LQKAEDPDTQARREFLTWSKEALVEKVIDIYKSGLVELEKKDAEILSREFLLDGEAQQAVNAVVDYQHLEHKFLVMVNDPHARFHPPRNSEAWQNAYHNKKLEDWQRKGEINKGNSITQRESNKQK